MYNGFERYPVKRENEVMDLYSLDEFSRRKMDNIEKGDLIRDME